MTQAGEAGGGDDPALDELRQRYREGNLVLFVGAGVSAAAGLPSWARLVDTLAQRARARGAAAEAIDDIGRLVAAGSTSTRSPLRETRWARRSSGRWWRRASTTGGCPR